MLDDHVSRDRLLDQLPPHRIAVVEAAAGFGKSTLAFDYARSLECAVAFVTLDEPDRDLSGFTASLRRSLHGAKLSDLAATMDVNDPAGRIEALLDGLAVTSSPLLLVFDDAHQVEGGDTATTIGRLARALPPPHRILVAARKLPVGLEPLRAGPSTICLDTTALTFTAREIAALAEGRLGKRPSLHEVGRLETVTGGWPTALLLALASPDPDNLRQATFAGADEPEPSGGSTLIAPLLELALSGLVAADRQLVGQLGHLPRLSIELVDALAGRPGTFDRLVAAGLPLARGGSGWWELPGPVSSHLVAASRLEPDTASVAAPLYWRSGEQQLAIRLMITAGLSVPAAAMLSDLSPATAEQLGLPVLEDLVESLSEAAVAASPRVLLHLARVAGTSHRNDIRTAALARARSLLAGRDGDAVVSHEVDAERARDLVWDERTRREARALATHVIAEATDEEPVARARALDVMGRLSCWFSDQGPQPEAERLLLQSARLSRRLGQPTWAAQALTGLAMGFYYALGRYDRTLETLDEALADLPPRCTYRAGVLSFRVDLLAELGRGREADANLVEMRELGRLFREAWIMAYASWSEMMLASYAGDAASVVLAAADAEARRDVWYDEPAGVEFLAQAADALSRVGEHDRAMHYLDRAVARVASNEKEVRVHEAAVLARSGEPVSAAVAVEAALARSDLNCHERWPLLLLRAHVAHRRGDPAAAELAVNAFEVAADLGHPQGPRLREPDIARGLLPLAAAAGSVVAQRLLAGAGRLTVNALGGFEVRHDRRPVMLPAGRPALAVRAVVGAGGRIRAESLIEILWPDTDPDTGRSRLRNLLNRLHTAAGEILVRDGDAIALPPGSEIDAVAFESDARHALRPETDGTSAVVRARSALTRYHGDLLPHDLDQAWADGYRQRLRGCYVDLLDLLADDAVERGEVDEAVRLTRRGIDAEPYDEGRYVRLATWLRSQGRVGTARTVLARGRAALAELSLVPSDRFRQVERTLGRPAGG